MKLAACDRGALALKFEWLFSCVGTFLKGETLMRGMVKFLTGLVLALGTMPAPIHSATANSGAEAFEKLKLLAGHWESVNGGELKATLDIELTGGGSAGEGQLYEVGQGKAQDR